jgi:hypothetical protein
MERARGDDQLFVMKRAAVVLGLLVLTIVLTIAGWIVFHLGDPPIDDSDLRIVYPPLADGENGALLLDALAGRVQWPDEGEGLQRAKALLEGTAWDEALARELLSKNEGLLSEAERIVGANRIQVRAREPFDWMELNQGWNWCRVTSVYVLRAIAVAKRGDLEDALEDIARMLRFARAMESAERADTTLLVYAGCARRQARRALGSVLASTRPDAKASLRWTRELDALRPLSSSWKVAFAEDYVRMSAVFRTPPPEDWDVPEGPWWLPDRYVFKPNATDRLWAEYTRRLQRWSERPCFDAPFPALIPSRDEQRGYLLSTNPGGKISFATSLPYSLRTADHRCRIQSDHAALVALVALRAYQVEHDALPRKLDALVPSYADHLPSDGFDGAPLRYKARERLMWTVAREREAGFADEWKASHDLEFAIPF